MLEGEGGYGHHHCGCGTHRLSGQGQREAIARKKTTDPTHSGLERSGELGHTAQAAPGHQQLPVMQGEQRWKHREVAA